jgi:predicted ATP-dependent serine protease
MKESRIPCSIDLINKITSGGIPRKTLTLFVAQPAGGKSLAMCSLAADYLRQGLNVLYITLELAEERIAERLDANMFNVPMNEIKGLDRDTYISKIDRLKAKTHGRLKIKEYPTGAGSASHFKILIDDLMLKDEFKPDVMLVDYLGITASAKYKTASNVNSYTYQKAVSEELRALAVEYDMLVISALQTNRTGMNSSDFDLENISDSTGPSMTADLMFGLIRTPELDELNQLILKQLKNRFGDPNYYKRFVVGVDKSRMKLYNTEESAQSGISSDVADTRSIEKPSIDRYSKVKAVKSDEWSFDE